MLTGSSRLIIPDQDPGWTRPPRLWPWATHCRAPTHTIRRECCIRSRATRRSLTADDVRWYDASKPDEDRPPPAKRARKATAANECPLVTEPVNPYTITRKSRDAAQAPPSPTYEPPSPPPEASKSSPGPSRQPPDHHRPAAERSLPPGESVSNQGLSASAGAQQIEGVSADQALSYAMQAQYMAGFWMGVAQSRALPVREDRREDPLPSDERPVSNVFFTRQHFQRGTGRLRR